MVLALKCSFGPVKVTYLRGPGRGFRQIDNIAAPKKRKTSRSTGIHGPRFRSFLQLSCPRVSHSDCNLTPLASVRRGYPHHVPIFELTIHRTNDLALLKSHASSCAVLLRICARRLQCSLLVIPKRTFSTSQAMVGLLKELETSHCNPSTVQIIRIGMLFIPDTGIGGDPVDFASQSQIQSSKIQALRVLSLAAHFN